MTARLPPSLLPNTLGVRCVVEELKDVAHQDALAESLLDAEARGAPATVVGGGSNLVPLARLPGMALRPRIRGLAFERLAADEWRVVAGAGETWHELVRSALGRGIGGLENLALIPGWVGAAPVQNIGAYGRELAEAVESVVVFDRRRGVVRRLPAAACGFGYRDSLFKTTAPDRYVVLQLDLRLRQRALETGYEDVSRELARLGGGVTAMAVAEAVVRVRRRKLPDPRRIGNVGSFFKNPVLTAAELDRVRARVDVDAFAVPGGSAAADPEGGRWKIAAARLIDCAGWKGVRRGAVAVWPRQPLVLVNCGGATGRQVLDLARAIAEDVAAKYGVALELEPAVVGVD